MPLNTTQFNAQQFNPPTPGPASLMEAVISALRADPAVSDQFGDSPTTPKFFAEDTTPGVALPYAMYTEADETPMRVFGGITIGSGDFEFGVFALRKDDCRRLLALVRATINGMIAINPSTGQAVTMDVGEGVLTYIRNEDNRSRVIGQTAPTIPATSGTQPTAPIEFGRAMTFSYKIVRTEP